MKLQRFKTRTVKATGATYYKWVINPPSKLIDALGWQPGEDLSATVDGDRLILTRN